MNTFRNEHFIDGEWVASKAEPIPVENPAERCLAGTCASGDAEAVDAAVSAARAAFDEWAETPPSQRAVLLRLLSEELKRHEDGIADTICTELGMPFGQCLDIQVGRPVESFARAAEAVSSFSFGMPSSVLPGARPEDPPFTVVQEPAGVVAAIAPWNYPLHQAVGKVAWALAAGCTVVLKPSELTPLNCYWLAQAADEVGLPPGVLNVVFGAGETGSLLADHREVDVISFTGSPRTGALVMAAAAKRAARVCLELGGKSAAVVTRDWDGDPAAVVHDTLVECYLNSGQTCNATTRLIVPDVLVDEVTSACQVELASLRVGHPMDPSTDLGPLVSERQWDRAQELLNRAMVDGAEVVAEGTAPRGGSYFAPMVIGVERGAGTLNDELFAPVLTVVPYDADTDPIEIANESLYGLSAKLWCDPAATMMHAERLRVGQVEVNGRKLPLSAPFGGYRGSGIGREQGISAIGEFLETKAISGTGTPHA